MSFLKNISNEFVLSEDLGIEVLCVDGHTEKQMIPKVNFKGKDLIYCADLIPTAGHIPVPYIMGYDVRPLLTMKEKSLFLEDAFEKDCLLFMEHDPNNEIVSLKKTEKGIRFDKSFLLEEL